MEFQFSKLLLNLGLECGHIIYRVHHFKGISCLSAHLAIPVVVILFPSNKAGFHTGFFVRGRETSSRFIETFRHGGGGGGGRQACLTEIKKLVLTNCD